MLKSKWFAVAAALALLVLVAGCASQAGSEPSTTVPGTTEQGATAPVVTESPVATPEVAATEAVTVTETVTGTTTAETGAGAEMEMPEQVEEVQRWAVLWDPEIGFEVRYPQGWLVGEAEVTDKDAPITRVYTLQPAEWAEDYAPILVEVSEGTEEDFRRAYIEPAETEDRSIGPLTYQYETSGSEGSMENFAVFTSPDDPDLRIVVRDVVTGFPERASAHADLATIIEQVTNSFRWRK